MAPSRTLSAIYGGLFFDANDEARKFLEALPNDELRRNVLTGLIDQVNFGTAEETR